MTSKIASQPLLDDKDRVTLAMRDGTEATFFVGDLRARAAASLTPPLTLSAIGDATFARKALAVAMHERAQQVMQLPKPLEFNVPPRFKPPGDLAILDSSEGETRNNAEKELREYAEAHVRQHWGEVCFMKAQAEFNNLELVEAFDRTDLACHLIVEEARKTGEATIGRMIGELDNLSKGFRCGQQLQDALQPLRDAIGRVRSELENAVGAFKPIDDMPLMAAPQLIVTGPLPMDGQRLAHHSRIRGALVRAVYKRIPELPTSASTWAAFAIAVGLDTGDLLPRCRSDFQGNCRMRWKQALAVLKSKD